MTCPIWGDPSEPSWEELSEMQVEALSAQLVVTAQATPTPLWAVDWGPTQPLEDETQQHFLTSQEKDHWQASTDDETWPRHQSTSSTTQPQQQLPTLEAKDVVVGEDNTKAEEEFEEGGQSQTMSGKKKQYTQSLEIVFFVP